MISGLQDRNFVVEEVAEQSGLVHVGQEAEQASSAERKGLGTRYSIHGPHDPPSQSDMCATSSQGGTQSSQDGTALCLPQ